MRRVRPDGHYSELLLRDDLDSNTSDEDYVEEVLQVVDTDSDVDQMDDGGGCSFELASDQGCENAVTVSSEAGATGAAGFQERPGGKERKTVPVDDSLVAMDALVSGDGAEGGHPRCIAASSAVGDAVDALLTLDRSDERSGIPGAAPPPPISPLSGSGRGAEELARRAGDQENKGKSSEDHQPVDNLISSTATPPSIHQ